MLKKDSVKIKEIKQKVENFTGEAICIACNVSNLCSILFDYCAYNSDCKISNLVTLAEIMKNKIDELIDSLDSETIEILKL